MVLVLVNCKLGGSPGQVSFKSTSVSNDSRQVCNSLGDDIIEDSRPTIVESDPRANASVAAPYADAVAGVTRQACRASDADIDTELKDKEILNSNHFSRLPAAPNK